MLKLYLKVLGAGGITPTFLTPVTRFSNAEATTTMIPTQGSSISTTTMAMQTATTVSALSFHFGTIVILC